MSQSRFRTCTALLLSATLAGVAALAGERADPPAPPSKPPCAGALQAMDFGDLGEALHRFEQARAAGGDGSPECLVGEARTRRIAGDLQRAAASARDAVALGADDPWGGRARLELARALLSRPRAEIDDAALREAAATLEPLAEAEGELVEARYLLGETLLRLGRTEAGRARLSSYVAADPDGRLAARAGLLLERPDCANAECVTPFELTTLDGETIGSRELAGKVVLLDFWATWCHPCQEAEPFLRRLALRRADQPFVIVGVSADFDEPTLRAWVAAHELTWPQVWDGNHDVARRFGVRSWPSYGVIDARGVMRFSAVGWDADTGQRLDDEIRGALDEIAAQGE